MTAAPKLRDPKGPLLVLVTGVQGTGKSTVANAVAEVLGAAVLAHDWAMSGLRPYPEIQAVLDAMDPPGHRIVGWSILNALARAQLQRGSSVVLDGVVRAPQIIGGSPQRNWPQAITVDLSVQIPGSISGSGCTDGTIGNARANAPWSGTRIISPSRWLGRLRADLPGSLV